MRYISKRTERLEQYTIVILGFTVATFVTLLTGQKWIAALTIAYFAVGYYMGNVNGASWYRSYAEDLATQMPPAIVDVEVEVTHPDEQKADPLENSTWDGGFDETSSMYPFELDIALQAWRAVSNNPTEASVREQLTSWVKNAYPELSAIAVERIVGVCNWNKSGGRPRIVN
jgi:hypothetical protein